MDTGEFLLYLLPAALLLMGVAALVLRDLHRKDAANAKTIIYRILLILSLLAFAAGVFFVGSASRKRRSVPGLTY